MAEASRTILLTRRFFPALAEQLIDDAFAFRYELPAVCLDLFYGLLRAGDAASCRHLLR